MQLKDSVNHISSNITDSSTFTIKASAKAFKILSDNLYSDKVTAIIRELSCNAYDSHVVAGKKDIPFDIHIPDHMESWFAVRDFGTGMSHEQMMTLYTSYFDSDKTGSNELIGALGLGSKSPFAYTDLFSVDSIQDKEKRSYSCFINESGMPCITLLSNIETEESNGVEVKFAVKTGDFYEFQSKIVLALRAFEIKPIAKSSKGILKISFEKNDCIFSGENWKFFGYKDYNSKTSVIQGNIIYPVDLQKVNSRSPSVRFVISNNFFVNFNIGDLDIAASREALSYDKNTIKTLENKFRDVYEEFNKVVEAEIQKCPNLWEARTVAAHYSKIIQHNDSDLILKYNGIRVDDRVINFSLHNTSIEITKYSSYNSRIIISKHSSGVNEIISLNPEIKTIFMVRHPSELKRAARKARHLCLTDKKHVFLMSALDKGILDLIGNPKVVDSYDVDLPPKAPSVRVSADKCCAPIDGINRRPVRNQAVTYSEMPMNSYYVIVNRGRIDDTKSCDFDYFSKLIDCAKRLKIVGSSIKLFAVPKRALTAKKFKMGNHTPVFTLLQQKAEIIFKQSHGDLMELTQKQHDAKFFAQASSTAKRLLNEMNISLVIDKNSYFIQMQKAFKSLAGVEIKRFLSDVVTLTSFFEHKIPEIIKEDTRLSLDSMYPLLKNVNYFYRADDVLNDLIQYINLVDAAKKG